MRTHSEWNGIKLLKKASTYDPDVTQKSVGYDDVTGAHDTGREGKTSASRQLSVWARRGRIFQAEE
jgi:hypothetical protein